jgi:hypothetical protein
MRYCWEYSIENGTASYTNYPYLGKAGRCDRAAPSQSKVTAWDDLRKDPDFSVSVVEQKLKDHGPLAHALKAGQTAFMQY